MSQKFKALDKSHPRSVVVTAGALAGVSEIVATYPLDTIKTVMQVFAPQSVCDQRTNPSFVTAHFVNLERARADTTVCL